MSRVHLFPILRNTILTWLNLEMMRNNLLLWWEKILTKRIALSNHTSTVKLTKTIWKNLLRKLFKNKKKKTNKTKVDLTLLIIWLKFLEKDQKIIKQSRSSVLKEEIILKKLMIPLKKIGRSAVFPPTLTAIRYLQKKERKWLNYLNIDS